MRRTFISSFALAAVSFLSLAACSGGVVPVGATSSQQQLEKKADGGATGDGKTCSWDDAVGTNPATGKTVTVSQGTYHVGDTFKAACNDCTCTAQGITCTKKDCGDPVACTEEAKQCPDGSYVGRTGPSCEFAPCPDPVACPAIAKLCPDGSSVSPTGPKCEFPACPAATACPMDAKQCPDGSYVGRQGPSCDFAPCP